MHWPAIIAQLAGGVAAFLWLNASSGGTLASVGPLAGRNGGSDFSVFIGLFVGGVAYYLLASREVRAEGGDTPVPAQV